VALRITAGPKAEHKDIHVYVKLQQDFEKKFQLGSGPQNLFWPPSTCCFWISTLDATGSIITLRNKKSQSDLGRAASLLLTAENNYVTRSPALSYTPIPRPTPLTTPNDFPIQSAGFPQFSHRTGRRRTDWQRGQTCTNTHLRSIDRLATRLIALHVCV